LVKNDGVSLSWGELSGDVGANRYQGGCQGEICQYGTIRIEVKDVASVRVELGERKSRNSN
jgi:hypothetical protein